MLLPLQERHSRNNNDYNLAKTSNHKPISYLLLYHYFFNCQPCTYPCTNWHVLTSLLELRRCRIQSFLGPLSACSVEWGFRCDPPKTTTNQLLWVQSQPKVNQPKVNQKSTTSLRCNCEWAQTVNPVFTYLERKNPECDVPDGIMVTTLYGTHLVVRHTLSTNKFEAQTLTLV